VDEELASKILAEEQLEIEVDLGLGGGFEARYYTCDFSYDYVRYLRSPKVLILVSTEVIGREVVYIANS
jgi:ArgJ family